jgi:target of EGR1 protein 1
MKGTGTTSYTIVNRHNLRTLSFPIKLAIQQASHIALDFEFTGLGDAKRTRDQNIEDRYIALAELSKTHAISAVGLSTFQKSSETEYIVNNFHFVMLSVKDHIYYIT